MLLRVEVVVESVLPCCGEVVCGDFQCSAGVGLEEKVDRGADADLLVVVVPQERKASDRVADKDMKKNSVHPSADGRLLLLRFDNVSFAVML